MTATGQAAWPARYWLTEPSSAPKILPCPREPTTSNSARSACRGPCVGQGRHQDPFGGDDRMEVADRGHVAEG